MIESVFTIVQSQDTAWLCPPRFSVVSVLLPQQRYVFSNSNVEFIDHVDLSFLRFMSVLFQRFPVFKAIALQQHVERNPPKYTSSLKARSVFIHGSKFALA